MWTVSKRAKVFLALAPVDMRKSFDGLAAWVAAELDRKPMSGDLFVFSNRRRNMVKVLYFERNGFCLWSKRLIEARFRWPKDEQAAMELRRQELAWLLEGLDLSQAHKKVTYDTIY
ncbi:IS66 family insertion sequence element accessory protein TnpB [Acanthopleuribacter pedis]|uniref:IS66 family insertion sequence element accessory protein TnpB n=1 Tax=Acanthopleuribacter pedis TaxID=442870 RepID=A0A8J7QD17_9BACT|nr:IS66 family insertion sequence element accessory protein TnpB [Acanthopleuribacter pedis]MBO1323506.1 IS66 family insertion sequence element accessory protein TnpB [Acanthopleuribacter pedis]